MRLLAPIAQVEVDIAVDRSDGVSSSPSQRKSRPKSASTQSVASPESLRGVPPALCTRRRAQLRDVSRQLRGGDVSPSIVVNTACCGLRHAYAR